MSRGENRNRTRVLKGRAVKISAIVSSPSGRNNVPGIGEKTAEKESRYRPGRRTLPVQRPVLAAFV